MTIRKLFILGSTVILLALVGILAVFVVSNNTMLKTTEKMITVDQALLVNLDEMYAMGALSEVSLRSVIIVGDETAYKNLKNYMTDFEDIYAKSTSLASGSYKERLTAFKQAWDDTAKIKLEIADLARAGNKDEAIRLLIEKETPKWRSFKKMFTELSELQKKNFKQELQNYQQTSKTNSTIMLTVILALIAAVIGFFLLLVKKIIIPVGDMAALSYELGAGNGDLTARLHINSTDELGTIAASINQFIEKVQSAVASSVNTATETAVASAQLQNVSRSLADNVNAQYRLAEEGNVLINDIVQNLDVTEEMAVTTTETLEDTQKVLNSFVLTLNEVGTTIIKEGEKQSALAASMKALTERASGINNVLTIIADIADQTNLLALNASIEAARAGESGRGFAVVADEVRGLASKTQNSLVEINKNVRAVIQGIEEIYTETAHTSDDMRHISESARELMSSTGATSERLHGSIGISSELVKKSTYIATRTKEMIENMNQLVEISGQNHSSAREVGEVSANLAQKSENLREDLTRFKV